MKTYTFYLHQDAEHVPAFEIELFDDRRDALAHAVRLLRERLRYQRIVVAEESTDIARLIRRAPVQDGTSGGDPLRHEAF